MKITNIALVGENLQFMSVEVLSLLKLASTHTPIKGRLRLTESECNAGVIVYSEDVPYEEVLEKVLNGKEVLSKVVTTSEVLAATDLGSGYYYCHLQEDFMKALDKLASESGIESSVLRKEYSRFISANRATSDSTSNHSLAMKHLNNFIKRKLSSRSNP
jgi:hypothetical protein